MTTHARDMTPEQKAAALAAIIKSAGRATEPPPTPIETEKRAIDMSELERREYLAEHKKRYGL